MATQNIHYQPWYHGKITRDEAETLLRTAGFIEGSYLLRDSTSSEYAISLAHNGGVVHYLVQCHPDGKYGIESGPRFSTPIHLIEHHKYHMDGLLTKLTVPCNRSTPRPKSTYGLNPAIEEVIKKTARDLGLQDDSALEEQLRATICKTLHKKEQWYHGVISRDVAERRLRENGAQNGLFLVRDSHPPGSFAIGVCFRGSVYHYLLQINAQNKICIDKGSKFSSVYEAVDHYKKQADGLLCLLGFPCAQRSQTLPRNPANILPSSGNYNLDNLPIRERSATGPFDPLQFPAPPASGAQGVSRPAPPPKVRLTQNYQDAPITSNYQGPNNVEPRVLPKSPVDILGNQVPTKALPMLPQPTPTSPGPSQGTENQEPTNFEKLYDSLSMKKCIGFTNCFKGIKEVRFSSLTLDAQVIGTGNFGEVLRGMYKMPNGDEIPVAVKSLKTSDISEHQKSELIKEARIMTAMDHINIVRMYGLCQNASGATLLVMELAAEGPLHKYLKRNRAMPLIDILILMLQVSEGMAYLSANNFIHRDLAARNVLVVNRNFVKISDFGLSTAMGAGEDYYKVGGPKYGKWPLKWYAPECILFRKFSPKTDVWSYGVTLYEAVTYGGKPYEGMNGQAIIAKLEEGYRLECPPSCPKPVYDIMFSCWEWNPDNRPTFVHIGQKMAKFITVAKSKLRS